MTEVVILSNETTRLTELRLALRAIGLVFIFGVYSLTLVFTIWSNVVHGMVMAIRALGNPMHTGHPIGDVPALFLIALVLGCLCPHALRLPFGRLAA